MGVVCHAGPLWYCMWLISYRCILSQTNSLNTQKNTYLSVIIIVLLCGEISVPMVGSPVASPPQFPPERTLAEKRFSSGVTFCLCTFCLNSFFFHFFLVPFSLTMSAGICDNLGGGVRLASVLPVAQSHYIRKRFE